MDNKIKQLQHRKLIKNRVGLLLIGITTLGVVIFLGALKLPQIFIAAKVTTDEIHLSFQNDWEIYDLPSTEVGFVNAENIKFDGEFPANHGTKANTPTGNHILVQSQASASTWSASLSAEDLRINIAIPARAEVSLSVEKKKLRISIAGKKTQGTVDTGSEFQISCNSCVITDSKTGDILQQAGRLRIQNTSQELRFFSTYHPFVISIQLSDVATFLHLTVGQRLQASKLDFQRGGLPVSAVSGSGSIAFPTLKLAPISIEPGDFLHIIPTEALSIRRITLTDAIEIEMEGSVNELRSGPAGVTRSRIPTFLQYFYTSDFIQLLLGAVMTIVGILTGVLYRFGYLSKI